MRTWNNILIASHMHTTEQILFQLAMVVACGGIIGAEREFRSKSAGFRTMILICLGSYLFTSFSVAISEVSPDRIASNIVTGIGFLGAGVIYKSDNRVNGITTAATIWSVAAFGMGIALELYLIVVYSTILVLAALFLLTKLERQIDLVHQSHTYRIVSTYREDLLKEYENIFDECKLHYKRVKRTKKGDYIIGIWYVSGKEKAHNAFSKRMLHHPSVIEFEF
jgi:putative Mg2+ transporter-C (MgtC) family protein